MLDRETVALTETLDVYASGLEAEARDHLREMTNVGMEHHPDPISLADLARSARELAQRAETLLAILGVKYNLDGTEGD